MNQKKNIMNMFDQINSYWSPKILHEANDDYIKIAKLSGSFVWHAHDEDEVFFIVKGHLKIELEDQDVLLDEGDLYVVPKGIRHNPVAEEECWVMLIEPKQTKHTGDVVTEKSKSIEEQLK